MRGSCPAAWEVITQRLTQPWCPGTAGHGGKPASAGATHALAVDRRPLGVHDALRFLPCSRQAGQVNSEEATRTRHQCLPMTLALSRRDVLKPNGPLLSRSSVSLCLRRRSTPTILTIFQSPRFATRTTRVPVSYAWAKFPTKPTKPRMRPASWNHRSVCQ